MAAQAGLSHTWSETPKAGFLVTRLNLMQLFARSLLEESVSGVAWEVDTVRIRGVPVLCGFVLSDGPSVFFEVVSDGPMVLPEVV